MTVTTIGKLAEGAGVSIDTLRYYERRGLVRPSGRTQSGYRFYDDQAQKRVLFIRRAQKLGFSLEEIGRLLAFDGSKDADASDVLALAAAKIEEHQAKIAELQELKATLRKLTQACPGEGPASLCPILQSFHPYKDSEISQELGYE